MRRKGANLTRRHAGAVALLGVLGVGAPIATAAANPPAVSAASRSDGLAIIVTTRTVQPKVGRTVRFNGYASYIFLAPRGRRIVSASARIVGGEARALQIRGRVISHDRTRYTVSLLFPGEQGTPGKLVVRLGTVA